MREFDPSIMTANPSSSNQAEGSTSAEAVQNEQTADISTDPFASYFNSIDDPTLPPKILITTSFKASKSTYEFCDELVGVFPGAEFRRRKKGKGFAECSNLRCTTARQVDEESLQMTIDEYTGVMSY